MRDTGQAHRRDGREQFHAAADIGLAARGACLAAATRPKPKLRDVEGDGMTDQDVFTTATAGLEEVLNSRVLRLRDGNRLDLDIGPVRKSLRGAELRMLAYNGSVPGPTLHVEQGSRITVHTRNDGDVETTVHWPGLRLENRYDGVPHETQLPIPIGGSYSCQCSFPTPASTGITRTSERTSRRRLAFTAQSSWSPRMRRTGRRPRVEPHAGRPAG
jgi:FtsP/CotA-like multicopper oxidase with cupredoxin domain